MCQQSAVLKLVEQLVDIDIEKRQWAAGALRTALKVDGLPTSGGVACLLAVLRLNTTPENAHDASVLQRHALHVLWGLLQSTEVASGLVGTPGATQTLVALLNSPNHHVQEAAAKALGRLASHDALKQRVANEPGSIRGLVTLLASYQSRVQYQAVCALWELTKTQATAQTVAGSSGALQGLVAVCSQKAHGAAAGDVDVVTIAAVMALHRLATYTPSSRAIMSKGPWLMETLLAVRNRTNKTAEPSKLAGELIGMLAQQAPKAPTPGASGALTAAGAPGPASANVGLQAAAAAACGTTFPAMPAATPASAAPPTAGFKLATQPTMQPAAAATAGVPPVTSAGAVHSAVPCHMAALDELWDAAAAPPPAPGPAAAKPVMSAPAAAPAAAVAAAPVTAVVCGYAAAQLKQATQGFTQELGSGGLGKVYRGMLRGTPVAIKVLQSPLLASTSSRLALQAAFEAEVRALSQLRHPHVVLLLGACPEPHMLVYELMEGGSLQEALFDATRPPLLWQDRLRIAHEVASALEYMHSAQPPVVHLDVKPANILLTSHGVSKLGDAGMARLLPASGCTANTSHVTGGTAGYIDPSYLNTGTYGPKSDVYSLGVVLLQLLLGKPLQEAKEVLHGPDGEADPAERMPEVLQEVDPRAGGWPAAVASQLAHLAADCMNISRRLRPPLATVVRPKLEQLAAAAKALPAVPPAANGQRPASTRTRAQSSCAL